MQVIYDETVQGVDIVDLARKAKRATQAIEGSFRASKIHLGRSVTLPMLGALQGKHIYAGTADPVRVAKDRKANKVARAQRRVNRSRNFRKGVR